MKNVTTLVLLLLSMRCAAQDTSATRPIDLRLDMASKELVRSADYGDAATYVLLFGGAITAIAFSSDDRQAPIWGVLTVAVTYGFTLKSSGHKRKAGHLLHQ